MSDTLLAYGSDEDEELESRLAFCASRLDISNAMIPAMLPTELQSVTDELQTR
jgi:hypothetical protein